MLRVWLGLLGPILRWLTPPRRRLLLAVSAVIVFIRFSLKVSGKVPKIMAIDGSPAGSVLLLVSLLGFVVLCYVAARNFAVLPLFARRHPQICLHAIYWALLVAAWLFPPRNAILSTILIGAVFALPFILWRTGYMMFTAQRGKIAATGFTDHFFYLFPLWGGSDTPYGKGLDYLSANEARDEVALARSQLAGIK